MTALQDPEPLDPEVLIEEARRRQRRRRASLAGVTAALVIAAAAFWITSGGGPPSGNSPVGSGGGGGDAPTTASWQELTAAGGYIAPGAEIASVVEYRGDLVAAGAISDNDANPIQEFSATSGPVVWVSRTGARWRVAFTARPVGDLDGGERLVVTRGALLLVDGTQLPAGAGASSAPSATELWRSTNLHTWQRVTLPRALATASVQTIAANGTRILVATDSALWSSSTDGLDWARTAAPPKSEPVSLAVGSFGGGFLATTISRAGIERLWRSTDAGASWSAVKLPVEWVTPYLTGPRGLLIGIRTPPCKECALVGYQRWWVVWSAPGSRVWRRVAVSGGGRVAAMGPFVFSARDGMLDVGASGFDRAVSTAFNETIGFPNAPLPPDLRFRTIFWSRNGKRWYQLTLDRQLPVGAQPPTLVSAGGSLLAVEQASHSTGGARAGALTFWRLDVGGV